MDPVSEEFHYSSPAPASSLQKIKEFGESLGISDNELKKFIRDQQELERTERQADREDRSLKERERQRQHEAQQRRH